MIIIEIARERDANLSNYFQNSLIDSHTIKNIQTFNLHELKIKTTGKASWHSDSGRVYIFIDRLNYGMNEGSIAIVFSQSGQRVDLRLARNQATCNFKGFVFLAYKNQCEEILSLPNSFCKSLKDSIGKTTDQQAQMDIGKILNDMRRKKSARRRQRKAKTTDVMFSGNF